MSSTNIRKGIYETNSSSVHVLCINTKNNVRVPENFTFTIGGQFGWEFDSYYDSESCGQYVYLLLLDIVLDKVCHEFKNSPECKELEKTKGPYAYLYPNKSEKYANLLKTYTNEYKLKIENILHNAGCNNIIWEEPNDEANYYDNGYIDHSQDAYEFFNVLIKNPDLLISFLFGGGSIHTGNDNDEYTDTSYDVSADYKYEKGN